MNKCILFELNEVPFRVIDEYVSDQPASEIAKLLKVSNAYVCHTEDSVQLDPWISWPTLHRGVPDRSHHIFHLGQNTEEIDRIYPPLWQIIKRSTNEVGVFGSLTSSTIPVDTADYAFYIPDYFSATPFAHPRALLPFQELNLQLTRGSSRNVSRKIPLRDGLRFASTAREVGISLPTVTQAVAQLAREVRNPATRIRRRSIQPLLMADLFVKQLENTKPVFASFYTNHVAAAMHRYWAASFPQDYEDGKGMPPDWVAQFKGEIPFAMARLDEILGKLVRFVDNNPDYSLVIASSMGQGAIETGETRDFLTVTDPVRFMAALGVPAAEVEVLPTMVPCVSVNVPARYQENAIASLMSIELSGQPMKRDVRPVFPLSYDVRENGQLHVYIQWDQYTGPESITINGASVSFASAGLGTMVHEDGVNCSAQHVKEGSLLIYKKGQYSDQPRQACSTLNVAPGILNHVGIEPPAYMRDDVDIFAA